MKFVKTLAACLLLGASTYAYSACEFTVEANDQMQYSIKEMVADSTCEAIKITIKHLGALPKGAMGHNWVLSKTEDLQAIAADGMAAGLDNDYIKPNDTRVLAHTKMVGGGESDTISFSPSSLTAGGDYSFFCSFPGHWSIMVGKFVLT